MTETRHFTDEELTAFLDGEADEALSEAIATQLETDPALEAQLAALDIPMAELKGAYDALLQTAPPMPKLPAEETNIVPIRRFGWGLGVGTFGTGIAAGIAMAVFLGLGVPTPEPPGWVSFVASYQSLYTAETHRLDAPDAATTNLQLASASDALGIDLTSLPAAEGLTFKRAQVLAFNEKPLIQIAYLRDDGTPVALCIIPAGPDGKPVNMGAAQGMELARWNTPGYGFLLIGGEDGAALQTEAETFAEWSADIAT